MNNNPPICTQLTHFSSMENPTILSTTTTASNSPEFEFRITGNPSSQQTTLHSADELFSGGLLLPLPLHHLHPQNSDHPPDHHTTTEPPNPSPINPDPSPDPTHKSDLTTSFTSSKRWKDIFKKNPGKKEKNNKKKTGSAAGGPTSTAELNINLWPFSRSRSAGNGGSRPRMAVGHRKVSSAPCSRSNSTGESKYRKWPGSPNRGGVHLGRSSPVWQVKRFDQSQSKSVEEHLVRTTGEKGFRPTKNCTGGGGGNVNVPTCIGYRKRVSCRNDVSDAGGNAGVAAVGAGGEGGASSLFSLRSLFTKKDLRVFNHKLSYELRSQKL
ncbi:hypothetical protein L6452_35259 [Arctium lappa]|uniref:Uncharacterized protein n=1 Tax=Arctium lappa TaxID=4217 RepID=A0ACB8Y746_ARCLA|nr:hypothetical protein L6452_35259 [Arctium lappa]